MEGEETNTAHKREAADKAAVLFKTQQDSKQLMILDFVANGRF